MRVPGAGRRPRSVRRSCAASPQLLVGARSAPGAAGGPRQRQAAARDVGPARRPARPLRVVRRCGRADRRRDAALRQAQLHGPPAPRAGRCRRRHHPLELARCCCSAGSSQPALAAGCTIVVKPASEAPVSTIGLAQLIDEAGFPPGVFNVVTGPGSTVGDALVSHRGVDKVAFTGSAETGVRVAQRRPGTSPRPRWSWAASRPTSSSRTPTWTRPRTASSRASSRRAARPAWRARGCSSSGPSTTSWSSAWSRGRGRIVVGDPMLPETEMGPMAFRAQQQKVLDYIDIARAEGAHVATGGGRPDGPGGRPVRRADRAHGRRNDMRIAREEVFGPVLSVIPFEDEEDAVRLANDTEHGLAAGLWTRDIQRAHRIIRRIRAGTIWVNAYRVLELRRPVRRRQAERLRARERPRGAAARTS